MTKVGELVGFQVGSKGRSRDECVKTSENTAIEFVTEGLLLFRMARSKEFLSQYDCVIIDEMHERNMEQDLSLSILREKLREYKKSRPDFKLVIMSASIDADRFRNYLDGCPKLDCPGRIYDIADIYKDAPTGNDIVAHSVDVLFNDILVAGTPSDDGDVLIFLSGAREIDDCVSRIRTRASKEGVLVDAFPLYSKLSHEAINQATNPDCRKKGSRKVICSTNLAETSLTIDGVTSVIESGLARKMRYCHQLRCSALNEERISQASIMQRRGRAGRTKPGTCYYLYSETSRNELPKYDNPQILESSVDALVLFSLDVCGRSIEHLGLLDCPTEEQIANSKVRLLDLELIEEGENGLSLSEDGKLARSLSILRPESIRMILNATEKYPRIIEKAMKLAVILSSTESIFDQYGREAGSNSTTSHPYGDHLLALTHFEWFESASKISSKGSTNKLKMRCQDRGLRFQLLKSMQEDVQRCHQELKRRNLYPSSSQSGGTDETLLRVAVSGYFHHLAEFFDSHYTEKLSFGIIGLPRTPVFLDRGSCLNSVLQKEIKLNFIEDDEDDSGSDDQKESFPSFDEIVEPGFLFYGNLFKSTKNTFMLDASVIDGNWILEEAPSYWIERVSFNPHKRKMVQRVIRNIGGKFLRSVFQDTGAAEEDLASKHELGAVLICPDFNFVLLLGNQGNVEKAGDDVLRKLQGHFAATFSNDSTKNYTTGLLYERGLKVRDCIPEKKTTLFKMFQAWGLNVPQKYENIQKRISVEEFKSQVHCQTVVAGIVSELREDAVLWKRICDTLRASLDNEISQLNKRLEKIRTQLSQINNQNGKPSPKNKKAKSKNQESTKIKADAKKEELEKDMEDLRKRITQLGKFKSKSAMVRFDEKSNSFAFDSSNDVSPEHFEKLINSMASRASKQTAATSSEDIVPFQRRRLVAVLKELRQEFPGALIHIMSIKTPDGETIDRDFSLREFDWLLQTTRSNPIQSVQILTTSISKSEAPKVFKALKSRLCQYLQDSCRDEEETKFRDVIMKDCVMCRRAVQVSAGKANKSHEEDSRLQGGRLHICGCCYCRACFVSCATSSLSNEFTRSVTCMLCKKTVLAQDCYNLIQRFSKSEWDRVCRLAEDAYCMDSSNITKITRQMKNSKVSGRPRGALKCPSCSVPMIHAHGWLFVSCRNWKCKETICTRCHQAIACEADLRRCRSSQCEEVKG